MRVAIVYTLAAIAGLVQSSPVPETHRVHERRDATSHLSPWTKRERLHPGRVLPIRVGLKQNNLHKGHEWLMDVSNPLSPNYGKHWSADEVVIAFQPAQDSIDAVRDWLVRIGGIAAERIAHSDNKGWLAFDANTTEAETLLHAEFHEYEHSRSGNRIAACDHYHVPKQLQHHIDYITPGVKGSRLLSPTLTKRGRGSALRRPIDVASNLPNPQQATASVAIDSTGLTTCDIAITPACVQALYNITAQDANVTVSANNSMGIFEDGDFYKQSDLNLFYANFTPSIPSGTGPIKLVVDDTNTSVPYAGPESNMDFQLAIPIVYPQTTTLYQVDDNYYSLENTNATGIFNTFFDAIDGSYCTYCAEGECGDDPVLDPTYPDSNPIGYQGQLQCGIYKPTNVISISYGKQEQDLPIYYQARQCNEFMKLSLQGVSIFVSSGDTGVGGLPNDGSANGCLGENATIFSPTEPNGCPYVTNVGAIKVYPGRTVFEPESALNDLAGTVYDQAVSSGGGFSNIWPAPDYQSASLATYFAQHDPAYPYYYNGSYNDAGAGLYCRNGRGIPDVAAVGDNIATFVNGRYLSNGGTSASAPIFAAIINRIIEERLRTGKGPLGFINPVLYQNPQVLNDITNGSNPGCGTDGFSAVEGWDPVTGLGTPNYPKMLDLFLSLP